MANTLHFLNQKYTCSEEGEISTYHSRNRKSMGYVFLGRQQAYLQQAYVCLCGCRIYHCDGILFTIRIDEEEINGYVIDHFFVNPRQYNLFKKHLGEDVDIFYGCTKTLEQLK